MNKEQAIEALKAVATDDHFKKLSRFGIEDSKALGVKVPDIRQLARKIGKNYPLAVELWNSEIHEAHLLAAFIADSQNITEIYFDKIVYSFDSWDVCDLTCDILSETPFAEKKMYEYANNELEFVKRTAFVLMCYFAVHHKKKNDDFFYPLLVLIERESWDERNFVRKAVNWALRQIGKRNEALRQKAIETAERILKQDTKTAKWIANDALRELRNEKIIARVMKKTRTKNETSR
ncbi:MAG: DNA alkylation repair protein [Paludibacteraceae bacterium]